MENEHLIYQDDDLAEKSNKRFRFSAKAIFLTYPKCNLTRQCVGEYLDKLGAATYLVAIETHKDGSPHIHAFATFHNRYNSTDPRAFDINGFHPHIRSPRNKRDVINYCLKHDREPLLFRIEPNKKTWKEIRLEASTATEYLSVVEENYPREAALFWDKLTSYANSRFQKNILYESRHADFVIPESIEKWRLGNLEHVKKNIIK